jgi:anthranilate phosphoribosyltransferase
MDRFKPLLAKVANGTSLSAKEAELAFDVMLTGEATPAQMGAFLMALRVRGETIDEITGAVTVMRAKMLRVHAPEGAVDIVGTGGDNSGSYNVSTLASLIAAAAGVQIAKHGNRAASSQSGASDVLGALGVAIGISPQTVEHCIREANVGFMMAQTHHAAMRHVGPVRAELGTRTIFNILGPLSNPAGVKRQVLGVFARQWLEPMAHVLKNLGSTKLWLVHGSDGLDELTTTGPSYVTALENNVISSFEVTPQQAGLDVARAEDLRGGDPEHNAKALLDVLAGAKNAYRDIAVLNAAAALIVADKCRDLKEAAACAAKALDSGAAQATLNKLIHASHKG